jgi:hypothetical protein
MMKRQGPLSKKVKAALADLFREYPYIVAVYQFGSTVRRRTGPLSDLDLALLLNADAPAGTTLARIESVLSYKIQRSLDNHDLEVDLVSLNGRSLIFQHTVLRTGKVIYDAKPEARRYYEWRIIQAYLSFEPTLRWMRKFQTEGWLRRCGVN